MISLLLPMLLGIGPTSFDSNASRSDSDGEAIVAEDALVRLIAEVHVPASEAGTLMQLSVNEGDLVKAGDLLGQLDNDLAAIDEDLARLEHEIATEKSRNDVDERFAQKSLEVAKSELALSENAVRRVPDSISKTELDRLRLVVDRASLSIEQARRDLRIAKLTQQVKDRSFQAAKQRVSRRQITAPINGMVVEILSQAGEWLNPGDPVVRLIRMDRLRVDVGLDGGKYGADLLGRAVELEVSVPPGDRKETFCGKVTFVSPEVQPINGKIRVWAEVENRQQLLRPGVHGRLTIGAEK